MSLSSGRNARGQAVGLTTALYRRLIMGEKTCCTRVACAWHLNGLPHPCHPAEALQRLMTCCQIHGKQGPKHLKEADWVSTCCPTCHVPEDVQLKTTASVLEGLMVGPRAWQKVCMLSTQHIRTLPVHTCVATNHNELRMYKTVGRQQSMRLHCCP